MLHARKVFSFRSGLHNIRPARSFLAARENSVAENVAKARLRIITCPFRISSTLWRNRLLRRAASFCWSIWPFELSELCRPDVQESGNGHLPAFGVKQKAGKLIQRETQKCSFLIASLGTPLCVEVVLRASITDGKMVRCTDFFSICG